MSPVLGSEGGAVALGSGPVYPQFFFAGALYMPEKASGRGSVIRPADHPRTPWHSIKTLWIAPKTFEGPLLVRGERIDGREVLRLGVGDSAHRRPLHLSLTNDALQREGSRHWTGATWGKAPGCYALQLDYPNTSETIVIEIGPARDV